MGSVNATPFGRSRRSSVGRSVGRSVGVVVVVVVVVGDAAAAATVAAAAANYSSTTRTAKIAQRKAAKIFADTRRPPLGPSAAVRSVRRSRLRTRSQTDQLPLGALAAARAAARPSAAWPSPMCLSAPQRRATSFSRVATSSSQSASRRAGLAPRARWASQQREREQRAPSELANERAGERTDRTASPRTVSHAHKRAAVHKHTDTKRMHTQTHRHTQSPPS